MLKKLIQNRKSIREYKVSSIYDDFINDVLEIAKKAPSAGAARAYKTYVVKDKDVVRISIIARQSWIKDAATVIVLCSEPKKSEKRYGKRGKDLYCIQDTTIYGAYLDLLFVEKGYGTCWVGYFKEKELRVFLDIPEDIKPLSLLVVGKLIDD